MTAAGQFRSRLEAAVFPCPSLTLAGASWGLDADALHEAYPDLSLAQIHAALSYYYAHQDEMDAPLARASQEAEALAANRPSPVTREDLLKRLDRE